MNKRSSATARTLAALAVVCGFLVVVVIVASSLGGGDDDGSQHRSRAAGQVSDGAKRPVPKVYVVEPGDTLSSIAHENGVSVSRILRLNPGVDPQILVSGEELKLR
jgi:LysM repeat protein